jgi:hypothetical protein
MTFPYRMRRDLLCGIIAIMATLGMTPAIGNTFTYAVDFPLLVNATLGFQNITGTIVTNCDNGCALGPNTVVSWTFIIPTAAGPGAISSNPLLSPEPVQVNGTSPIIAEPTELVLNPQQGRRQGNIIFDDDLPEGQGQTNNVFFLFRDFPFDGASIQFFSLGPKYFETFMGPFILADDDFSIRCLPCISRINHREERRIVRDELAVTSLPAALPLFVSGLAVIALLGARRKRNAAPAAIG